MNENITEQPHRLDADSDHPQLKQAGHDFDQTSEGIEPQEHTLKKNYPLSGKLDHDTGGVKDGKERFFGKEDRGE